jgi:hypothetical protein
MDENKFSYKEVLVRYDNVLICVICSKMVEKVFEYNAHDDEDVSANYVYYVKKKKFSQLLEKFFLTSQEQLEKVFLILDK